MFKAVCSECGRECEVPFKPDPNRPVYCRECWAKKRPPRPRNRY
ncbi:MAG: CxxC-x17-CxxC domain-containing protein [Candidatus Bathyarchaeia archaeon]